MTDENVRRFAGRRVDRDTKILSTEYLQVDGRDILVENWRWEAIRGKSLIFLSEQLAGLSDAEVDALGRKVADLGEEEQTTLKRGDEFTFFNFAFSSWGEYSA